MSPDVQVIAIVAGVSFICFVVVMLVILFDK
jgi:hypothetical protein